MILVLVIHKAFQIVDVKPIIMLILDLSLNSPPVRIKNPTIYKLNGCKHICVRSVHY